MQLRALEWELAPLTALTRSVRNHPAVVPPRAALRPDRAGVGADLAVVAVVRAAMLVVLLLGPGLAAVALEEV